MSKPASRVDLTVPFSQKDKANKLGAKWDIAKRVWYALEGEQPLLDRWGPGCGPPTKKRRQASRDTFLDRPGWTVDSIRHGPCGQEIVIKADKDS